MSIISHKMFNDSIGKMNENAYYSLNFTPNNPETEEEKKKREKKRIQELKSSKTKEQIKKILLTAERNKDYDEEICIPYEKIFISGANKDFSEEKVQKIAEKRAEIRKNTISDKKRDILDNMILIGPKDNFTIDTCLFVPKRYG